MNWQHLMYFKAVAQQQNFTKAAEELYITSSALSKAINNLEDELGFSLFVKIGRNSYLTPHGNTFYQCVSRCSDEIDLCTRRIHDELGVVKGQLRIGGIYTMCAEYLPEQIKVFKELYPNVTVNLEYHVTHEILQMLQTGEMDLGFCSDFDIKNPAFSALERMPIFQNELIILVPLSHPLADRETVWFSELKNENFIVHKNRVSGTGRIFYELCKQNNFVPKVEFEVPDDQSIIGLVRSGLGIALIVNAQSLNTAGTKMIHLKNSGVVRKQYMVWRKGKSLSPVAKAFHGQVKNTVKEEM